MKTVVLWIIVALIWGGVTCFIAQPYVAAWRNKRKLRAAGKLVDLDTRRPKSG